MKRQGTAYRVQGTGKITSLGLLCLTTAVMAFAAPGGWLKSVPAGDKARTNPYAGQAEAIEAGKNLFTNNCSKCHGTNAEGKGRKPALVSDVLRGATDGEIQWLIKNGEPSRGCPDGARCRSRNAGRLWRGCGV